MGSRLASRGLRAAALAAIVLGTMAAAVPWALLAADGSCCSMPACCGDDRPGCDGATSIDRVGCCGPAQPVAVSAPTGDAPATRESTSAAGTLANAVVTRAALRFAVLLGDRDVSDGPPSPVPLFTVHAALLM